MDADRAVIAVANLRAFNCLICACEGTLNANGTPIYTALFGYPMAGRTFDSFADHPRRKFQFAEVGGNINWTTAAGAYQIIAPTFDRLQKKLHTSGFTPMIQDMMAAELITEAQAMPFVQRGDVQGAMDMCAGIWASLPASRYAQPHRTAAFALNAYIAAGGVVA